MRRFARQGGMVSAIFLVAVLPVMMVLLCLGLELTHFFGARDDVQRLVDRVTRASLTKGMSGPEAERALRAELAQLHDLVSVESVKIQRAAQWSESRVEGRFRGVFSELAAMLAGSSQARLPVSVHARIRRVEARVLIVLDRSAFGSELACDSEGFKALASFVESLSLHLVSQQLAKVSVAVIPGASQPLEVLQPFGAQDLLPRCRPRRAQVGFDVPSLAAAKEGQPSASVGSSGVEALRVELLSGTAESRAVVVVQRWSVESQLGYGQALFSALDADARARRISLNGIHVLLDGADAAGAALPAFSGTGVRLKTVRVSGRELAHPNLVAAVRGSVGDRTVLVF